MGIQVETATAPAHWACGLINGDWSGSSEAEEMAATAWEKSLAPFYIVGIEESEDGGPGFLRWHDAAAFCPLAADCAAFILHRQTKGTDQ